LTVKVTSSAPKILSSAKNDIFTDWFSSTWNNAVAVMIAAHSYPDRQQRPYWKHTATVALSIPVVDEEEFNKLCTAENKKEILQNFNNFIAEARIVALLYDLMEDREETLLEVSTLKKLGFNAELNGDLITKKDEKQYVTVNKDLLKTIGLKEEHIQALNLLNKKNVPEGQTYGQYIENIIDQQNNLPEKVRNLVMMAKCFDLAHNSSKDRESGSLIGDSKAILAKDLIKLNFNLDGLTIFIDHQGKDAVKIDKNLLAILGITKEDSKYNEILENKIQHDNNAYGKHLNNMKKYRNSLEKLRPHIVNLFSNMLEVAENIVSRDFVERIGVLIETSAMPLRRTELNLFGNNRTEILRQRVAKRNAGIQDTGGEIKEERQAHPLEQKLAAAGTQITVSDLSKANLGFDRGRL